VNSYSDEIKNSAQVIAANGDSWSAIDAEYVARMRLQNRFKTGLDIAKYNAKIMREDMEAYDKDSSQYTQSLGVWHGFIAQQKMISIKKGNPWALPVPVWLDDRGTSFRVRAIT